MKNREADDGIKPLEVKRSLILGVNLITIDENLKIRFHSDYGDEDFSTVIDFYYYEVNLSQNGGQPVSVKRAHSF